MGMYDYVTLGVYCPYCPDKLLLGQTKAFWSELETIDLTDHKKLAIDYTLSEIMDCYNSVKNQEFICPKCCHSKVLIVDNKKPSLVEKQKLAERLFKVTENN